MWLCETCQRSKAFIGVNISVIWKRSGDVYYVKFSIGRKAETDALRRWEEKDMELDSTLPRLIEKTN